MTGPEWFRCTSWSDADRDEFERRLARARRSGRAQYLRIQAFHLAETGQEHLTRVALDLLARLLRDFPDDIQAALAHGTRAECLLRLGDWDGAVGAFRAALEAERAKAMQTSTYLRFAYLVATRDARDLFDEAERVVREHDGQTRPFPVQQFQRHAALALLCVARGDGADASWHARTALEAAGTSHSGFCHHARLGLVQALDPVIERRLLALAGRDATGSP